MIEMTTMSGNCSAPGRKPYCAGAVSTASMPLVILWAVARNHFPDGRDHVVGVAVRHLRVERQRNRPVGIVLGIRKITAAERERLLVIRVKVHGAEVHADADVLRLDGVHD